MLSPLEQIDWNKTGILPGLINDYIEQKQSISFLSKYPFQLSSFKDIIADKAKDNTDRKLLAEVLKSQYQNIPTSKAVTENIESLLSENTFTVTAAHQPCLFLGPLYNVYKIACAINVANQLKQQYPEYNFVPVFWLGTEDHDVEELNHAFVNGKKIEWQNPGAGASGRWKTAGMKAAIEELKAASAQASLVLILEEGLKKFETFGRFTQYFVNEIFKEQGLVVLDQDDKRLKNRFKEVIQDELLNSRAAKVLKKNVEFLEENFKAQAKPRDINFFYLGDKYRERIVYGEVSGRLEINNTDTRFSREEILTELDKHPERFSPNVIYRPLYQEMILPNLAFVGGAGELSYWLELKPLFDFFKVNYPMQIMRNSALIVNPAIRKKLEKLDLSAADFFTEIEQLVNAYVQKHVGAGVDLSAEKKKVEELYETVLAKAEASDVTLKQSASAERQKAIAALENLEAKMLKAEKRKQETSVNQLRGVHAALFPNGALQERSENFIPYYSPEFISFLTLHLNPFSKQFVVFAQD